MMKSFWLSTSVLILLSGCVENKAGVMDESARSPAATPTADAKLIYITYDTLGKIHREEIAAARTASMVKGISKCWLGDQDGFSDGGRADYLAKFYSANTRGVSLKGIRHAACFEGRAQDIQATFFSETNSAGAIRGIAGSHVRTKTSTDGKMIGISFENIKGSYHFRMTSCDFGKSDFSDDIIQVGALKDPRFSKITMQSLPPAKRKMASDQSNAAGFLIEDKVNSPDPSLPSFSLRADYENAVLKNGDLPWQGMDLTNEKERVRFSLMMQKYFYEGMANQDLKNPDQNFIAAKNKDRFWCHTPWMQLGISGREGVHGLTKELDLRASKVNPVYTTATAGSDWGVAYFNAPGCHTLQSVFGSNTSPLAAPNFNDVKFEQGTVIVKILFTTADFPKIAGAYTWTANASEPGSAERSLKKLRHIQMDIAVKDASLKGSNSRLRNMVMTGYYYDPDYSYEKDLQPIVGIDNPLKQIAGLPTSLMKMRPMGVQTGFDSPTVGDTVIFPGAYANGSGGRMNGPADNPRTSCLGCHGAAGTGQSMVPGFLSWKMYEPFEATLGLDFNQQLAVAKDNFETTP